MPSTYENTAVVGNPDAIDAKGSDQYAAYRQTSDFAYVPGVFVLPLANGGVVTGRVHKGYGTRTVRFNAIRRGQPPVLPAAADTDRDVLVSADVQVPLPAFSLTQPNFDWNVSGEYVFVTTHADGPRVPGLSRLPAGQYPFPLPLQDSAGDAIASSGGMEYVENSLYDGIQEGTVWPFTIMPKHFFNPLLLRED